MNRSSIKDCSLVSMKTDIDRVWDEISESVAQAFRMPEEEKNAFKSKDVAKLIGSLPFIAGCDDAHRTAVTHLGSYVLSVRETKPYFHARPEDNAGISERLRLGNNFKGGNPDIIEKGMSILALIMVNDYKQDEHIDDAIGKYNPVSDGTFDHSTIKAELERKIESVVCPEIDRIICGDVGTRGYWGYSDRD